MDGGIIIEENSGDGDRALVKFSGNEQCQNEHQNELNATQEKAPIGKLPNNSNLQIRVKQIGGLRQSNYVQFSGNTQSHQVHDI